MSNEKQTLIPMIIVTIRKIAATVIDIKHVAKNPIYAAAQI